MINREYKGPIPNITHRELVDRAFLWLRCSIVHRSSVAFRERSASVSENPDAIGFYGSGSTLIECKASRSDFLSDKAKYFRQRPEAGMGLYRYFMAPVGLLKAEELPDKWGLLEVYEKTPRRQRAVKTKKDAEPFYERNLAAEISYLVSAIRRIDISMAVFVEAVEVLNPLEPEKEDMLLRYGEDLISQHKRIREFEEAIKACRSCNDNGEPYTSPTADSAQCLSNLFSMVDENNNS